ncbi:hypothetical protein [Cohaesibacter haloalkalitolerans]|uniref:hypothetical protein n=1 Tax=Cohaesibacter haloalkalitolerans TaxID=1162980 RepID=UPI000E653AF0|nr:hypothetical protein [Cohaesibacter haloalkalitolerans]
MGVYEPDSSVVIDTHFHANVFRRNHSRRRRIATHLASRVRHLHGLCSTEHAYKRPLEAYDFLCDMVRHHGLSLHVVPGVENISREGVEVIQLCPSRQALAYALEEFPAFSWSIHDAITMQSDECITILPHPFSPSTTGIVTGLGLETTCALLPHFDYIEMSNGSFLEVPLDALPRTKFKDQLEKTAHFPEALVPAGVGRSFGSDAHRPRDINLFSAMQKSEDESFFEALATRQTLKPIMRTIADFRAVGKISRGLLTSSIEYMQKQDYKLLYPQSQSPDRLKSLTRSARKLFID